MIDYTKIDYTKENNIIVGIDPGVQHIGIAIFDILNPQNIITMEYSLEKKKSAYFLLYMFFIEDVIDTYKPSYVVIEKPFFTPKTLANNIRTLEVIGIIKTACQTPEVIIPTTELSPCTIKKRITGTGKAKKDDVIKSVRKHYPNTSFSSHTADALSVALTFYAEKESINIEQIFIED